MKSKILLLLCCAFLSISAFAETAAAYRYSREILWKEVAQEEILAVPLDAAISAETRDGYPDVRILNAQGDETPYVLERVTESRSETHRENCNSELLSLQKTTANSIELVLRLDRNAPAADGLTLITPLSNYEHRIQVFGTDDGAQWSPLVKDALIFDYTRFMDIRNRDVALPPNKYRQFKIVVDEATQMQESQRLELTRTLNDGKESERAEASDLQKVPLRIDRIAFWRNSDQVVRGIDKKFDYPDVSFQVQEDSKKHITLIDVTTRREPLTGLSLLTSARNFTRQAEVRIMARKGIEESTQPIARRCKP